MTDQHYPHTDAERDLAEQRRDEQITLDKQAEARAHARAALYGIRPKEDGQ